MIADATRPDIPLSRPAFRLACGILVLLAAGAAGQTACPLTALDQRDDQTIERVKELDAAVAREDWPFVASVAQQLIDAAWRPWEPPQAPAPKKGEERSGAEPPSQAPDMVAPLYPDPSAPDILYAIDGYVVRRLSSLPDEAIAVYRAQNEARAAALLRRGRLNGDDAALEEAGRRYRLTESGLEALMALGHGALARGRAARAARLFEEVLAVAWREGIGGIDRGQVRAGLGLAYARLGERELLGRLAAASTGTVAVAGVERPVAAYLAELAKGAAAPHAGHPGLARPSAAPLPKGPEHGLAPAWSSRSRTRTSPAGAAIAPQPVADRDLVIYHSRTFARAVDLASGEPRWTRSFSAARPLRPGTVPVSDSRDDLRLRGAVGAGIYAFVAAPRETDLAPHRRLVVALDRATGLLKWKRDAYVFGRDHPLRWDESPLIVGDHVFVTATDEGDNPRSYVVCLAAQDGTPRWATRIGSAPPLPFRTADGELPPTSHFLGSLPMTHARGRLYVADNLGSVACLDAATGRPAFVFRYDRRQVESSGRFDQGVLARGWDANPVRVEADRLVVAPDDSDQLYFLYTHPPEDAERRRKNLNYLRADTLPREGLSQLLGLHDGVAYVAGRDPFEGLWVVRALSPYPHADRNRICLWDAPAALDTEITGRGYLGKNGVYVCSRKYVYRIDLQSGAVSDPILSHEADGDRRLGNIVLIPDGLLLGSREAVGLYVGK